LVGASISLLTWSKNLFDIMHPTAPESIRIFTG
jgi:hypothetical protein